LNSPDSYYLEHYILYPPGPGGPKGGAWAALPSRYPAARRRAPPRGVDVKQPLPRGRGSPFRGPRPVPGIREDPGDHGPGDLRDRLAGKAGTGLPRPRGWGGLLGSRTPDPAGSLISDPGPGPGPLAEWGFTSTPRGGALSPAGAGRPILGSRDSGRSPNPSPARPGQKPLFSRNPGTGPRREGLM